MAEVVFCQHFNAEAPQTGLCVCLCTVLAERPHLIWSTCTSVCVLGCWHIEMANGCWMKY